VTGGAYGTEEECSRGTLCAQLPEHREQEEEAVFQRNTLYVDAEQSKAIL
jgi:hypothetical protein